MNRYEPRIYQTLSGYFSAAMRRHYNGTYITYESHKQEIEYLQARLKALESKQKDSISISSIIAEHVDDAIRKSIGEAVHQAIDEMFKAEYKYNGDPCHSAVDSILDELAVAPGKTVKDDTYSVADGLTKNGKFTFGSNFGEGKEFTMPVGETESEHGRKVAVCYYVAGNANAFIKGCEYEYEVDECEPGCEPRIIHIVQDAFVSDLKCEQRWDARKVGEFRDANGKLGDAYVIVKPGGGVVAQFYIK
ncbi:hypothetical protein CPL00221_CDS0068 [Escherichia phage RobRod40]